MRRPITSVYQLKIVLDDIRPQIVRRVQVPADIRLDDLHTVIQTAMGWTDSHLHAFDFGSQQYTMPYEPGALDEMGMEDERKVRLSELLSMPRDNFGYEYDFGDGWEHTITLEKILPVIPTAAYPFCVDGKRACPPEDCGGPPGYLDLLRILKNPHHEEYKEMLTWVGRKFDPEAFDLETVNKRLQRLKV